MKSQQRQGLIPIPKMKGAEKNVSQYTQKGFKKEKGDEYNSADIHNPCYNVCVVKR